MSEENSEEIQRRQVLEEILQSEIKYVKFLEAFQKVYIEPLMKEIYAQVNLLLRIISIRILT